MNCGSESVVTSIILTIFALLFLILRRVSRVVKVQSLALEDYLASFALLLSAGYTAIIVLCTHMIDIPLT